MSCWPYTTRRWERLRRIKLQTNPLCEACLQEGRIEPATVVDHRIPITKACREQRGAEAFPALDRLASLCASCHNTKSRAEQLGQTDWMRAGCDIFGRPNNPDHLWNKERDDVVVPEVSGEEPPVIVLDEHGELHVIDDEEALPRRRRRSAK